MKKFTIENINKLIKESVSQFKAFLKTNTFNDPAVKNYYRLLADGISEDESAKMVSCVTALYLIGKHAGCELVHRYIEWAGYLAEKSSFPAIMYIMSIKYPLLRYPRALLFAD